MNKHFPEVVIAKSEALYMLWIDFSKLSLKCGDIYDFFLERMHIKVAKGKNFGMDEKYKNFVRINFACPRWIIEEIIKRMYAEMKSLREL